MILNVFMILLHVILILYLRKYCYYVSRETLLQPNHYFVIDALIILTCYKKLCCYMITGNKYNKYFDSYSCTSRNYKKLRIELLVGIYYNRFIYHTRVITFSRSDL